MRRSDVSLAVFAVAIALLGMHWLTLVWGAGAVLDGPARAELAMLLVSQAVWPLLPMWAIAAALASRGRARAASVVTWGGSGLVWLALGMNLACLLTTGSPIKFHLRFLGDEGAIAMAGGSLLLVLVAACLAALGTALAVLRLVLGGVRRSLGAAFVSASHAVASAVLLITVPLPLIVAGNAPASRLESLLVVPLPSQRLRAGTAASLLDHVDAGLAARSAEVAGMLARRSPADPDLHWPQPPRASVVFVIVESLRHDALSPETMPRTFAWGETGIRAERHYTEANNSHRGTFALLYGRSPLDYEAILAERRPSPLFTSLRSTGYHCAFFAAASMEWQGMETLFSSLHFDEITIDEEGTSWAERDARNVGRILERLRSGERQCIVLHVNSTHFPYDYPPAFNHHRPAATAKPSDEAREAMSAYVAMRNVGAPVGGFRERWWNRYRNAAGYLDQILAPLLAAAGADTLVVVTGDHGESFYEDGTWLHASKQSDVQTLVPLRIAGGRLPRVIRTEPTRHMDVVPTVLRALGAELIAPERWPGRDLAAAAAREDADVLLVNFDGSQLVLLGEQERLHLLRIWGGGLRATQFEDARAVAVDLGPGSATAAAPRVDAVVAALERRSR